MSGRPPPLQPSPLTLAVLQAAASSLVDAVEAALAADDYAPLISGIVHAADAVGVSVQRVQLPLNRYVGFRHPLHAGILMTWTDADGLSVRLRSHDELAGEERVDMRELVRGTVYYALMFEDQAAVRYDLTGPLPPLAALGDLSAQGYVDYVALGLPMPGGRTQVLSLAARGPMPADACARLLALRPTLSLAIHSAHASLAARQLAALYIGRRSGRAVLDGEMFRGHTRTMEAGILFCDLRGFTAMTDQIGAGPTIQILNRVFDALGEVVSAHGGEILKFIGDAMLAVFPVSAARPRDVVAEALVAVAREGLARVARLPEEAAPLQVGFGAHLGEVQLGNIGTIERLDFTVIGAAVNLASRLEGQCAPLGEPAIFSADIARTVPTLRPLGRHALKGIAAPMPLFGLPRSG